MTRLEQQVPRRWILEDNEKPWTINAERTWHYQKRAKFVKGARTRFGVLALAEHIPHLDQVTIEAVPIAKDRRGIQDVAACLPAVKAGIDSLVDTGVLTDDTPEYVLSLKFWPTQVLGYNGLRLIITEAG